MDQNIKKKFCNSNYDYDSDSYSYQSNMNMNQNEKKEFSNSEINRISHLLKKIEKSRLELAQIQGFYSTCSINFICEPAYDIVEHSLGQQIMWTN